MPGKLMPGKLMPGKLMPGRVMWETLPLLPGLHWFSQKEAGSGSKQGV
jgi:hypothetical protein